MVTGKPNCKTAEVLVPSGAAVGATGWSRVPWSSLPHPPGRPPGVHGAQFRNHFSGLLRCSLWSEKVKMVFTEHPRLREDRGDSNPGRLPGGGESWAEHGEDSRARACGTMDGPGIPDRAVAGPGTSQPEGSRDLPV